MTTTPLPQPVPDAAVPPWVLEPGQHWITVGEFARQWNKYRGTIRQWCETGFLSTLGIPTYRDPRGHWYIRVS